MKIPPEPFSGRSPVVAAWGMGVDSTAMIIEWIARGYPLDVVLTADTGTERPETYEFLPIFQRWMDRKGLEHHVVRYEPKRFKHWPPYFTILENCLTNATLPSASFNRKSCSVKWKIAPQNQWVERWPAARSAWASGRKVTKLIGYDASPADSRRYAHQDGREDPLYEMRYPLREWSWDRNACTARIRGEGLPIPVKSSCYICAAMRPDEVASLPPSALRLIVLLEARAAPRLRQVEGLWRRATRARPGCMTDFIRLKGLLEPREIESIIAMAPRDLINFQEAAAQLSLEQRPILRSWIDRFNAGLEHGCGSRAIVP